LADITQGNTNMCSAFAFSQAFTILAALQLSPGDTPPQLSPVYAYYFQRVQECATTGVCACPSCTPTSCTTPCAAPCTDCGSYLAAALSVFATGVAPSSVWPLTSGMNVEPSAAAVAAAAGQRITEWACINNTAGAPAAVLAHLTLGHPVVVFLELTPAMETWMTGLVGWAQGTSPTALENAAVQLPAYTAPGTGNPSPVGHVVVIVGYSPLSDVFIVRNSFGFSWGAQGRFTIPRAALTPPMLHTAVAVAVVAVQ